ncbi:MAG: hypothetical protein V4692_00890 [Bdellovibrionota bacterium]
MSKPKNPTTVGHNLGGKLGRTLGELESAISDWEALSKSGSKAPAGSITQSATAPTESGLPADVIEKTKHLLDQLKLQLKELSE